jgi:hypothetical protein
MRSRQRIPDNQLRNLACRLLRVNRMDIDTPVIVSTMEGDQCCSVGRLLDRGGARVSALMDTALERARAVTIFLPENSYVGEIRSCVPQGDQFTVELGLIMSHGAENGMARKFAASP